MKFEVEAPWLLSTGAARCDGVLERLKKPCRLRRWRSPSLIILVLRPSRLPAGTYPFAVDKDNCGKSLALEEPQRQAMSNAHWAAVEWDIMKHEESSFKANDVSSRIDESTLSYFMDAFLEGITTIPYFNVISIAQEYSYSDVHSGTSPPCALLHLRSPRFFIILRG